MNYKLTFFRQIRKYINVNAAKTIYKSTILPIIEYADFIYDYNIQYVGKMLQKLQNQGLYTVYNQHFLHYAERDSTETLHREANLFRLQHRRKIHLLAFSLTKQTGLLDNREIQTRRHDARLFIIPKLDHYKCYQDPTYRAKCTWNSLNVETRDLLTKGLFINTVKSQIDNPYAKI